MPELTDDGIEMLRRQMARAEVIFFMDVRSELYTVVFGKRLVGEAIRTNTAVRKSLTVLYRPGTSDFEGLLRLVTSVKGFHEYYGE